MLDFLGNNSDKKLKSLGKVIDQVDKVSDSDESVNLRKRTDEETQVQQAIKNTKERVKAGREDERTKCEQENRWELK